MEHKKRVNVIGEFAKKGEDIKKGDRIKVLSNGIESESQFKNKDGSPKVQVLFSVETRNGAKNVPFNQTSINAFVDEYGKDDENWKGQFANVLTVVVPGKPAWYYFAPDGYEIGEYGLEKVGGQKGNEEIPTINVDDILF